MLPQKRKVGTEFFAPILKGGKTTSSEHLSFRFISTRATESRFSLVVSGKISKKATERNLLKRRGYAIIKKNNMLKKIPIAGVFFAKNGATKLSYVALKQELNNLLIKARVI